MGSEMYIRERNISVQEIESDARSLLMSHDEVSGAQMSIMEILVLEQSPFYSRHHLFFLRSTKLKAAQFITRERLMLLLMQISNLRVL